MNHLAARHNPEIVDVGGEVCVYDGAWVPIVVGIQNLRADYHNSQIIHETRRRRLIERIERARREIPARQLIGEVGR